MKVTKVDQVAGGTAAVAVAIDLATSIAKELLGNGITGKIGNVDVGQDNTVDYVAARISNNLTTKIKQGDAQ